MERLKPILAQLKKYHFWILTVVAIVAAIACWYMSTSSMNATYLTRKGEINTHFTSMTNIRGMSDHPNDVLIDKFDNDIEKLKDEIHKTWMTLHTRQHGQELLHGQGRKEGLFVLPGDFDPTFKQSYYDGEFGPGERDDYFRTAEDYYTNEWLNSKERLNLRREIKKAVVETDNNDPTNMTNQPVETVEMIGLLEWDDPEIFNVSQNRESPPVAATIFESQEDYWIYENLMGIVASLNRSANQAEGTEKPKDPIVERIENMEVGAKAIEAHDKVTNRIMTLPAVAEPAGQAAEGGSEYSGAESGATGARSNRSARYVDFDWQPVVKGAESDHPEFKLVPIRLRLVMNQTKIPEFLRLCANSDEEGDGKIDRLPIKVTRFCLNPGLDSTPLDLTKYLGSTNHNQTAGTIFQDNNATEVNRDPDEIKTVEIFGVIRLYEPLSKAADQTSETSTATGDTAANATAADGTATTPVDTTEVNITGQE